MSAATPESLVQIDRAYRRVLSKQKKNTDHTKSKLFYRISFDGQLKNQRLGLQLDSYEFSLSEINLV